MVAVSYLYPHTSYDKCHMVFTIFPRAAFFFYLLTVIQQRRKHVRILYLLNIYFVHDRFRVRYFYLILFNLPNSFILSERKQVMQGSDCPDLACRSLNSFLMSLFLMSKQLLYHTSFQNNIFSSMDSTFQLHFTL